MQLLKKQAYSEEDLYQLPDGVHAELIDGQIYNMAPPSRIHQRILNIINTTIYNYIEDKKGKCEVYTAPFAVKLFPDDDSNIVEPDISVICDLNKLTDKGCTGAPDWVIEIVSPSNPGNDYIRKLNLYLEAGVREYWIVNPERQSVLVYGSEGEKTEAISYSFEDRVRAGIYEDLYIDFSKVAQKVGLQDK